MNESLSHLLAPREKQAVERFVDTLLQQYPERVLETMLFGSKARGDSTPDSDIDILLIVDDDDWQFSHLISTIAARVSLDYDVLIGPRVIGRERWESMKRRRFSLYRNIAAEGIPLTPEPM
jgi:predicted nucleotidyltransferase